MTKIIDIINNIFIQSKKEIKQLLIESILVLFVYKYASYSY